MPSPQAAYARSKTATSLPVASPPGCNSTSPKAKDYLAEAAAVGVFADKTAGQSAAATLIAAVTPEFARTGGHYHVPHLAMYAPAGLQSPAPYRGRERRPAGLDRGSGHLAYRPARPYRSVPAIPRAGPGSAPGGGSAGVFLPALPGELPFSRGIARRARGCGCRRPPVSGCGCRVLRGAGAACSGLRCSARSPGAGLCPFSRLRADDGGSSGLGGGSGVSRGHLKPGHILRGLGPAQPEQHPAKGRPRQAGARFGIARVARRRLRNQGTPEVSST
jgi:hypothetical protein